MKTKLVALLVAVTALVLTGCAVPNKSLSKAAQMDLGRVQGVVSVAQNNLEVVIAPSYYPAYYVYPYGSLFHSYDPYHRSTLEMIDAIRQDSAERVAEPLVQALRGFDYSKALQVEAKEAVDKAKNIKWQLPFVSHAIVSESAKRVAVEQSAADAVLFCEVFYRLHGRDLQVVLVATVHPKSDKLKAYRIKPDDKKPLAEGNAIYKQVFSFTKQYVSAETIKVDLLEGGKNVLNQLAADINLGT